MKKIKLFFCGLLLVLGCRSNVSDIDSVYEEITFQDMREIVHPNLEIIDSAMAIVTVQPGRQDTTGVTKILLNGIKIYEKEWPPYTEYASPVTIDKPKIIYAKFSNRQMIILADKRPTWFDTLLVIADNNVKTYAATFAVLKKAECREWELTLTVNNSWIRTDSLPDETLKFAL